MVPLHSDRSPATSIGLRQHLAFTLGAALALLLLFALMRLALLLFNRELAAAVPAGALLDAFGVGLRFDLRLVVIACAPMLLAIASYRAMQARRLFVGWLALFSTLCAFLGAVELNFYHEFQQRLNSLVFQYLQEDPATVLSMLWHGFPVLRLLLACAAVSWLFLALFRRLDRATRRPGRPLAAKPLPVRLAVLALCLLSSVALARGTLRQGPPLRWGDAFHSQSIFANHLALNGVMTLANAAIHKASDHGQRGWVSKLGEPEAWQRVRGRLLVPGDALVDPEAAPVRRVYTPPAAAALPGVRNVVVILLESFNGHYVGALGSPEGITPHFDALAREGVLFTRFFSNGTHTHQGMFATMACFPNLPGYEYLMNQSQATHAFSGLPQLLSARKFDDVYVYNGDFAWDNQRGFFRNQGMQHFVGRNDFVDPVFSDPTWGVSDQDMFGRAVQELAAKDRGRPFYALLQTLSNHTPYALPDPLPVPAVTGHGALDQHLTAMRYSDWALGQFFERARREPFFKDTLFVVLGDHGFGTPEMITEMSLHRFNVPMLLIGPGARELFGERRDVVGSQVDVVPTIMGRLGQPVRHQCWGRDLLALPEGDPGIAVIKPSGNDATVAVVEGERILVQVPGLPARLYRYALGAKSSAEPQEDAARATAMGQYLDAYLHAATRALLDNRAGVE